MLLSSCKTTEPPSGHTRTHTRVHTLPHKQRTRGTFGRFSPEAPVVPTSSEFGCVVTAKQEHASVLIRASPELRPPETKHSCQRNILKVKLLYGLFFLLGLTLEIFGWGCGGGPTKLLVMPSLCPPKSTYPLAVPTAGSRCEPKVPEPCRSSSQSPCRRCPNPAEAHPSFHAEGTRTLPKLIPVSTVRFLIGVSASRHK